MGNAKLIVVNLGRKEARPETAFIMVTSLDVEDIVSKINYIVTTNLDVIPEDLHERMRAYGLVFTEWDGLMLNAEALNANCHLKH
ncbi:MAG: hypothetical protein PHY31_02145 [Smithellaceae bacterium]|nr:hypothetical protein [Smithellaceae bacterium]